MHINKEYYYLVASLPYLKFGQDPGVSRNEFLAECEKWLDAEDIAGVISADVNELEPRAEERSVVREWKRFDLAMREELAKIRLSAKEGSREKVPLLLKDIFEERTPLLAEENIQKKRWDFLEELESGFHFDINVLIIYCLKIQILERMFGFDKEKGREMFKNLCEVKYG